MGILALFIVLCALSAASAQFGEVGGPPECIEPCKSYDAQLQGFAFLVEGQKDAICLCNHDGTLIPHSLLVLNCDWENYSFNLRRVSSGQAIKAEFKQLRYSESRKQRIAEERMMPSVKSTECKGRQDEVSQDYPYVNGQAEMSIEDGRLYYNTFVELKEVYETKIVGKCVNQREFKRKVTLSCCADRVPTPGATSVPPITPPVNQYCPIANDCANAPISCGCSLVDEKLQISHWYSDALPNNLAVQLTKLEAYATGSSGVVQSFVENGVLSSLSSHLGLSGPVGVNPQNYAVNPFEFADSRGSSVTFKCEAEYCSVGNAFAKKFPVCRSNDASARSV